MDIDYMVVADAATAQGNKHYIHGGGWDTIWSASFPVRYPSIAVALRLRVPWHDTNRGHEFSVDLLDADGRSILPNPPGALGGTVTAGRPPNLEEGQDQVVPLSMTFVGAEFPAPGTYAVTARLDGEEVARSPIQVRAFPGAELVAQGVPPG